MSIESIEPPDIHPDGKDDPATLATEAESLAQAVQDHLNHPADLSPLMQRISLLEDRARTLATDDLSLWLGSLRKILEFAR